MLIILCNECYSDKVEQNPKLGVGKDKNKELICKNCGHKMALSKIQYKEEIYLD